MIDGIIKGDGTSRKMKAMLPATYEEFKQAAGAGEQTLDVVFNAPGWQQQPTFLNKQNLGQDKTMAVYNRGPEGTVDDLFQSVFAVGDIKVSARTDLGDSWLLCNGEPFDTSEYPALKSLVVPQAGVWKSADDPRIDGYTVVVSPVGNYVVRMKTDLTGYGYRKLSDDKFVEKQFGVSGLPSSVLGILGMDFRNGKFITWPKHTYGNEKLLFYFSDNIDGPWEVSAEVSMPGRDANDWATEIGYANGYYYYVVQYRYTGQPPYNTKRRIAYSNNPKGEWTVIDSPFDQSAYINGLVYNTSLGKWLIFSDAGEVKVSSGGYPGDFSGTLQTPVPLYSACDGDGTIYAGSKAYQGILKLEPGSQEFEKIDYPSDGSSSVFYPYFVVDIGDFIVCAGNGGTTTYGKSTKTFYEKTSYSVGTLPTFFDGYISWLDGSNSLRFWWQKADVLFGYKTPEISHTGAYAYIRGK